MVETTGADAAFLGAGTPAALNFAVVAAFFGGEGAVGAISWESPVMVVTTAGDDGGLAAATPTPTLCRVQKSLAVNAVGVKWS